MNIYDKAHELARELKNCEEYREYKRLKDIAMENETQKVAAFARERNLKIVGEIPRSDDIIRFEEEGKTVIEGDPGLPVSRTFLELARTLLETET
jgi:nitrogenase iron protein NifH